MQITTNFESSLYIGSREGYHGYFFSKAELIGAIAVFQDNYKKMIPVRITDVNYVRGTAYHEHGWEVTAIQYPRRSNNYKDIRLFMEELAVHLLQKFKQNRITVKHSGPNGNLISAEGRNTIMFSREGAEEDYKDATSVKSD